MATESSVDSMWMDNLEEWVGDQNEVVTVKSLSRGLKVRAKCIWESSSGRETYYLPIDSTGPRERGKRDAFRLRRGEEARARPRGCVPGLRRTRSQNRKGGQGKYPTCCAFSPKWSQMALLQFLCMGLNIGNFQMKGFRSRGASRDRHFEACFRRRQEISTKGKRWAIDQ